MNEQGKIELGNFIQELKSSESWSDKRSILIASFVLDKIYEIESKGVKIEFKDNSGKTHTIHPIPESDYQIGTEKRHICVVCTQTFPIAEMPINFSICGACDFRGLEPNSCLDKNGAEFFPGAYLKNEASSATVQILKISDTQIFDDKNGATDREDFVNAGWIVHERITVFTIDENNRSVDICKFHKSWGIGAGCWDCDSNKGMAMAQRWVICELYNKENEG